jgi:alanyl-tRNA synthetase
MEPRVYAIRPTEGGKLVPLPHKNVDTGMGWKGWYGHTRVQTNFDINIFSPIIKSLEEITHLKYNGRIENAMLMRRIADHVKAYYVCISDGVCRVMKGVDMLRDGCCDALTYCFYN